MIKATAGYLSPLEKKFDYFIKYQIWRWKWKIVTSTTQLLDNRTNIFPSHFAWIRTLDIRMNDSALFHCATTTTGIKYLYKGEDRLIQIEYNLLLP